MGRWHCYEMCGVGGRERVLCCSGEGDVGKCVLVIFFYIVVGGEDAVEMML